MTRTESTPVRWMEPALLGSICCLLSALCYTGANICLRQLAELKMDPAWVICVKEAVAVTLVGPCLLVLILRGQRFAFPIRAIVALALAGLVVQLAGNRCVQWAFGVVGLAISAPLTFGVLLVSSSIVGRLLFGELLAVRSIVAIGLVIVSIGLLGMGVAESDAAQNSATTNGGVSIVLLGIGAACLGGAAFAVLGTAIRYAGRVRVPVIVTVVIVTGMGLISLGIVTLVRKGPEYMLNTDPGALAWMIASGVFNVIAFALITKGLHLTTLVHANVLNASQVALGAAAGILLFSESSNPWLLAGIGLSIASIMVFGQPKSISQVDAVREIV